MAVPAKEVQRRITRFKEALQRVGAKLTHQRLEVFLEVARLKTTPTL